MPLAGQPLSQLRTSSLRRPRGTPPESWFLDGGVDPDTPDSLRMSTAGNLQLRKHRDFGANNDLQRVRQMRLETTPGVLKFTVLSHERTKYCTTVGIRISRRCPVV